MDDQLKSLIIYVGPACIKLTVGERPRNQTGGEVVGDDDKPLPIIKEICLYPALYCVTVWFDTDDDQYIEFYNIAWTKGIQRAN